MQPDLPVRRPGSLPAAVRDAATRADRTRRPIDARVLERVRDALVRLPGEALNRRYLEIPGDYLAFPRAPREVR